MSPDLDKPAVLITDDDEGALLGVSEILQAADFELVLATTGEEALRQVLKRDFATIIMDIHLPGIDGIEAVKLMRQRPRGRNTPVIFLTATDVELSHAIRGYAVGAVDYLCKPPTPEILRAKIEAFVDLWRQRRLAERQAIELSQANVELTRTIAERLKVEEELEATLDSLHVTTGELEAANEKLQQVNSELQRREKLLQETNLRLAEASRAKSEFLANMSHELRTPLNSIIGFSDILGQGLQGELTREQAESVRDINDSGQHLLSLINEILDLSKVEAGKIELEPEEIDIGKLVRASLIFFKEKALKHRLALDAEISDGTGAIVADTRKVKQVLINLLSNAVRFTPDGGRVQVRARRVMATERTSETDEGGRGGEFVEIAVEDTGIGIAPEDQKKLFQPFQQVHTALTKEFAGTGLGLSLCKSFVELHGGSIRVESEPGRGSTFTFRLPVMQAAKREPLFQSTGAASQPRFGASL